MQTPELGVTPFDLPILTSRTLSGGESSTQKNAGTAQTPQKYRLFRHETGKSRCKIRWKVCRATRHYAHRTEIDILDPLIVNYLVN